MTAIFKRDFRAYFTSPIGYVFCAIFLCLFSFFFYLGNILSSTSDMSGLFSNMLLFTVFLIPVLTMRVFSEEYKQKTDQLLLTAPVKLRDIVLGKFLASLGVFLAAMIITLSYSIILSLFGQPEAGILIGNYVAYIALSSAFFSIGIFISSLTESQIVAGIISWGVFLGLYLIDAATALFSQQWVVSLLEWISLFNRYETFTRGVFALSDFLFYISVCVIFLFLTTRVLEKKRWS